MSKPVQSVQRALRIMDEILNSSKPLSLTELIKRTNLHPTTTYRLLSTLVHEGFVYQDTSKEYMIGSKLISLRMSPEFLKTIQDVSNDILQDLSDACGELTSLAVWNGNQAIYRAQVSSRRMLSLSVPLGVQLPIHCTAVGKAILAYLDENIVNHILQEIELTPCSPNTITTSEEMLVELKKIRGQGFALDNEEQDIGIRCIGAPVFRGNGSIFGAIAISGPAGRLSPQLDDKLSILIRNSAQRLSARLGFKLLEMEEEPNPK